ncbi:hypothetical protein FRC08_009283 [Ceratobasidium sp. 394]|nr:hypothetical protein FRC08_009283 [Ceratobasidium sp. 394]
MEAGLRHLNMDFDDLTPEQLEQLANATFSSNKPLNFGPFVLGSLVDALLCGILLMQCGRYISSSDRDGWLLKVTVAGVITMNLLGTAIGWAWVWDLFVRNFGTYRTFFSITYFSWSFVIGSVTGVVVQTFFALRAWRMLNRNLLFALVIITLMLCYIGSGLAVKILFVRARYSVYASTMKVAAYIAFTSMVFGDVIITTIIIWYLLTWRTTNPRINGLLKKLIRVTFESQLPPTLVAIGLFIAYTIKQDSFVLVPLIWVHPKSYAISLLHTLNMRSAMTQPTVVFGTTFTVPSCTTGQFAVGPAQASQTEGSDAIPHSQVVGVSQSRSYFSTRNTPPKTMVVSFEKTDRATPGDTLKVDVAPMVSHTESSDVEAEMVERKSKLPDLESSIASEAL